MKVKRLMGAISMVAIGGIGLYFGTSNTSVHLEKEQKAFIEKAIKQAMVQCYVLEGAYPPDIAYLEKNYGLILDHRRYLIYYDGFASNIMPSISVIPNTWGGEDE